MIIILKKNNFTVLYLFIYIYKETKEYMSVLTRREKSKQQTTAGDFSL